MSSAKTILGTSLDIYLEAIRPFIKTNLIAAYPSTWWTEGVEEILPDDWKDRINLRSAQNPGKSKEEFLEPREVEKYLNVLLAKNGMGAEVAPVDVSDNYVQVTSRLLRIANRVLWRAGFASVSDSFLMTPNMIQGRIHAWLAEK